MRIGIFADTYTPMINGVVTSIVSLEEALTEMGYEVYIITTDNKNPYDKTKDNVIRFKGFNVPFSSFKNFQYIFFTRKYVKEVKKLDLDIIHVHTEFSMGRLARHCIRKLDVKSVYTYHTMYEDYIHHIPVVFGSFFTPLFLKFVRYYTKKYVNKVDQVVIPSEKVEKALEIYNIDEKLNIIPSGINLKRFEVENFRKNDIDKLKKSLNIENEFIFLSVGRIAKEKSIDELIKAFYSCKENYKLIIVGDGPDMDEIKHLVERLRLEEKIIFTGFVAWEEVGIYYQLADVYLSASETETQGMTFIESLGSSLPVLAKYDDNLKDLIKDKENGILYYAYEELPSELNKIINDKTLLNKLIKNSKSSVKHYSNEEYAKNILKLYKSL